MSDLDPEFRKKFGLSPLHYGYGPKNVLYHYTPAEWGIGGRSTGGGIYQTRSLTFMVIITIFMVPVATLTLLFGWICVFSLNPLALFLLPLSFLFLLAVYVGGRTSIEEWRARGLRKAKGLPKPWQRATDDQAYEWYSKHPHPEVPLTLEYFPLSYKLKDQAKWEARKNGEGN